MRAAIFLLSLLVTIAVSSVAGQEESKLGGGATRLPAGYDAAGVNRHVEGSTWGFRADVDFEILPQPLKVSRATVTITADSTLGSLGVGDWRLGFDTSEKRVRWLSDEFVVIPGPVEHGDVFTIPLEFMVLEAGQFGFNLYWASKKRGVPQISIIWCLGKDGDLQSLGNEKWGQGICDNWWITFFDSDSVRIVSSSRGEPGNDMFTGDCKIEPPFKIGEPSTVCFRLVAVEDHPDGIDLEISWGHMQVSGYQEPIKGPVYAGDSLQICFTAVPLPVRERHQIALTTYDSTSVPRRWVMGITSLFAEDGSLRYIENGSLEYGSIDSDLLPKSFPTGTKATCGSHWIKRDQ